MNDIRERGHWTLPYWKQRMTREEWKKLKYDLSHIIMCVEDQCKLYGVINIINELIKKYWSDIK